MKSKTIPLILIIVAVALGGIFFVSRKLIVNNQEVATRAKVVTPKADNSAMSEAEANDTGVEGETYETFVPLYNGETLISTIVMDINSDGYDDEVIAIRTANSPNLSLVPAIIDSESGTYTRLAPIPTKFTSTRTFSYSSMDVVGDHKNALIYQGVDDDSNYVMEIYRYEKKDSFFGNDDELGELVNIGSFSCDGTIFIQQVERSESYELSLSKGESFSVWVYKSEKVTDPKTGKEVENQIQQEYKWKPSSGKYELARELKVPANRLAAKELSRIQDGTVETFAGFLDGLWYKTSNTDGNIRYMYFDYDAGEIILLKADTEEVYLWEDSKLRHNGIYLTAVNADIMNLRRRFDVSLVSVDEIRVSLQDYINLLIKENNMWEGNYKKMSLQSSILNEKKTVSPTAKYSEELIAGPAWISADKTTKISFTDYNYNLLDNDMEESGIYAMMAVGEHNVIQFRSDSLNSLINDAYSMKFGTKVVTETVRRKTVETVVPDYDTVVFSPVKIASNDCFAVEGRSFTFTRDSLVGEAESQQ